MLSLRVYFGTVRLVVLCRCTVHVTISKTSEVDSNIVYSHRGQPKLRSFVGFNISQLKSNNQPTAHLFSSILIHVL